MSGPPPDIAIPDSIKPADGRFGSGPSKVRTEAVDALAATGTEFLGTSHRQATVQFVVGSPRCGAAATPDANLDENSPKLRCWLRSSISPKIAASQNAVVPPLPSRTS